MKDILLAFIYALVVVPLSIAVAWVSIWWSVAFVAITLFLYFKVRCYFEDRQ